MWPDQTNSLDSDVVVHRDPELLLAPEISFSRLYGHVPEEELDLIQFAARDMTQTGARTPEVMRCELLNTRLRFGIFDYFPIELSASSRLPDPACLVD